MSHAPLILILMTGTLVACSEGTREDLPDWSSADDTGSTGGPDDDDDDDVIVGFSLLPPADIGIKTRLTKTGTDEPCTTNPEHNYENYEQLDCTLDIPELDLWGYGLNFDLEVGEGSCDYLLYNHYMYEAWEVGQGPSTVTIRIDDDGEIVGEENAIGGTPYCSYDYTSWTHPDAPNCCLGSYTMQYVEDLTDEVLSSQTLGWGGNAAKCYNGAAYLWPEAQFSDEGWPLGVVTFLNRTEYQKRFTWDPISLRYFTNVPLANYYDPADHDDDKPAGMGGAWAQETYTFGCTDHAQEYFARIDLTVREWNEEPEWDAEGDPDTTGFEPLSGDDINDHNDWADATPGNEDFIQFSQ